MTPPLCSFTCDIHQRALQILLEEHEWRPRKIQTQLRAQTGHMGGQGRTWKS